RRSRKSISAQGSVAPLGGQLSFWTGTWFRLLQRLARARFAKGRADLGAAQFQSRRRGRSGDSRDRGYTAAALGAALAVGTSCSNCNLDACAHNGSRVIPGTRRLGRVKISRERCKQYARSLVHITAQKWSERTRNRFQAREISASRL